MGDGQVAVHEIMPMFVAGLGTELYDTVENVFYLAGGLKMTHEKKIRQPKKLLNDTDAPPYPVQTMAL